MGHIIVVLHAAANWTVTTLPDEAMLLLHVRGLRIGIAAQVAICQVRNIRYMRRGNTLREKLSGGHTLDEPVLGGLFVLLEQWLALDHMVGRLVQGAILEALPQDVQDLVVHHAIPPELLIRLEAADGIVCVALIDGWHTTEALMVPIRLLLIRFDNRFCAFVLTCKQNKAAFRFEVMSLCNLANCV